MRLSEVELDKIDELKLERSGMKTFQTGIKPRVCGSRSYQIHLQTSNLRLLLQDHFRHCTPDIKLIKRREQEVTHENCKKLTTLPVDFVAILVNQSFQFTPQFPVNHLC
jgi:hypothetical protein